MEAKPKAGTLMRGLTIPIPKEAADLLDAVQELLQHADAFVKAGKRVRALVTRFRR